jgi:ABC-2 type transport system ATP-binding protein
MEMAALEVDRLSRAFRVNGETVVALRHVSMRIEQGQIVGLLGGNGAGKTTLTKTVSTLLLPTSGTVRVFGHDVTSSPREARRALSVVFGGDRGLYGRLNARENLRFFAMIGGLGRRNLDAKVDDAIAAAGLGEAAGRPVETYSKGMRQRVHVAAALITRPRLLLLDEPTLGLDPVEAERLRTTIDGMRREGVSVLLTSHYLLDIERLCDRVVLLARGQVVGDMSVRDFARTAGYIAMVTVRGRGRWQGHQDDPSTPILLDEVTEDGLTWTARLRVRDWDATSVEHLARILRSREILDVAVTPLRLEDVYASFDRRSSSA